MEYKINIPEEINVQGLFGNYDSNVRSVEKFTGTEFGYLTQSLSSRDSSHIVRETVHHVLVGVAGTRGNDNSLLTLLYNLRLGWMYRWHWAAPRLTLLAGGAIDGTLGGAYDTRNSNNAVKE